MHHGITDIELGEQVNKGLHMARMIIQDIDSIIASTKDRVAREQKFREFKKEIEETKKSTNLSKRELRMPGLAGLRLSAVKHLLRSLRA